MLNKQKIFLSSDQRQPKQDAYWETLLLIRVVEKYWEAFTELSASTELFLKSGTVGLFVEALLRLLEVLPRSETSNLPSRMCFLNILTKRRT